MDNIKEIIDDAMPFEAKVVMNILKNKGHLTYIVGGSLRDCILSKIYNCKLEVSDWDYASCVKPEELKLYFDKLLRVKKGCSTVSLKGRTELLIPSLGTTSVKIGKGKFEITPVKDIDIYEDLAKRDFTINSMAYNEDIGLIYEYEVNGQSINVLSDIERKIIRCNINPYEYVESNPVAVIRGLRFANKFGFDIEEETLNAFKNKAILLRDINKGKLYVNFEKIVMLNELKKNYYIKELNLLESICDVWNKELDDEFIKLLLESISFGGTIKDRLRYIAKRFSNKDMIIELYKSFGVKKDFLMYL